VVVLITDWLRCASTFNIVAGYFPAHSTTGWRVLSSNASISLFQFRYHIDTIFTKYRDVDISESFNESVNENFKTSSQ